jgi:zinc transport system substrate-binding protein
MRQFVVRCLLGLLPAGWALPAPAAEPAPKPHKIKIIATLFPFADWAAKVGGDHVEVVALLKPGSSPHTYELTTKDVKAIQNASLLVYNGSGLDDWAGKLVETSARKGLVKLDLARHLPPAPMPVVLEAEGAGGHDHDDSQTGCGMWLDPMRAVRMIDLIAETLGRIDPIHRVDYQKNARDYWSQLDRLDRLYRAKLDPRKGGVVCFHADFIYLFRRYGVEVYGIVEPYPGKEPSLDYLRKLTAMVSGKPLLYVATEPQLSEKPAQVLAKQLGVPLISTDPIGGTGIPGRDSFISLMTYNLNQLVKGQKEKTR